MIVLTSFEDPFFDNVCYENYINIKKVLENSGFWFAFEHTVCAKILCKIFVVSYYENGSRFLGHIGCQLCKKWKINLRKKLTTLTIGSTSAATFPEI
mgnify:CR=1 FL=1